MRHISNVAALHCQERMKDNELAEVSVSVDGTWQKRYGHNSLLGASFVLSVDSGQVMDYAIKSKTCHLCKRNPDTTAEWKMKQEHVCEIHHKQLSGAMERDAVVEMFLNSVEQCKLMYTEYVGDGDTNSFCTVVKALEEKFGDEYTCVKEDCAGHAQKRMGSALHNYKSGCRSNKLPDGTVGGGGGGQDD